MKVADGLRSELTQCLKALHLPAIRSCYEEQAELARREGLSHEQYLLELLHREQEIRQHNRTTRLLRESRLPLEKSLEAFDRKRLPARVNNMDHTLLEGAYLDRTENVLAFGQPGSGKTHLLCGIAQALVHRGRRVLFMP
jgi:DNA replication protein DnaC